MTLFEIYVLNSYWKTSTIYMTTLELESIKAILTRPLQWQRQD